MSQYINKPTPAFIAASWCALILGAVVFCIGLFNANMMLNEKAFISFYCFMDYFHRFHYKKSFVTV
ncbi:YiaA/YiaB family inner membrane protein [Acinetobacter sp. YH12057]|uniref:YiaA/YiaB family inner membrane protein n=1 Tax=Acinetobacter sp. YH12057 TaxID=2601057 RepID=UPI0035A1151B